MTLAAISVWIEKDSLDCELEVDGGVKASNIREIADAGADMFVAGSAIFGADDYGRAIAEMREKLGGAC